MEESREIALNTNSIAGKMRLSMKSVSQNLLKKENSETTEKLMFYINKTAYLH